MTLKACAPFTLQISEGYQPVSFYLQLDASSIFTACLAVHGTNKKVSVPYRPTSYASPSHPSSKSERAARCSRWSLGGPDPPSTSLPTIVVVKCLSQFCCYVAGGLCLAKYTPVIQKGRPVVGYIILAIHRARSF
jgi:hypothetical protein